jgi:multiple antibiotic resistance protein
VLDDPSVPIGKLFPLLFMMMGPIGVMPIFAALTATADHAFRLGMARKSVLYAGLALVLAVVLGASVLMAWGATPSSLMIASGLLLSIAALRNVLGTPPAGSPADLDASRHAAAALTPMAFPTMASPHAIGVLIIFVAYFPSISGKATILAAALGVLGLNYLAMLNAERFMTYIGMTPLRILGAVFGVLQIALAIEMIVSGIVRTKIIAG